MNSIRIEMLDDKSFTVAVSLTKPATDKEKKDPMYCPRTVTKEFSAKDKEAVAKLVDKYTDVLQPDSDADEFDEAYEAACCKDGD